MLEMEPLPTRYRRFIWISRIEGPIRVLLDNNTYVGTSFEYYRWE